MSEVIDKNEKRDGSFKAKTKANMFNKLLML